jgi:hypothetical protein
MPDWYIYCLAEWYIIFFCQSLLAMLRGPLPFTKKRTGTILYSLSST